jgi:hypothetical protein
MTTTLQPTTGLLHTMLEEQLRAHTNQLAELTAHSRSRADGYDPAT